MKRIPILMLAALILSLTLAASLGFGGDDAAAQGPPQVIGVDGVGNVGGQPVLVHILAVVHPGENAAAVARAVLAAQGARPFTPADFSLTGSVDWNGFPSAGLAQVTQRYNPSGDPTGGGGRRPSLTAM